MDNRNVAQPGRALRSGRRGRRFKSCHSDHNIKGGVKHRLLYYERSALGLNLRKKLGSSRRKKAIEKAPFLQSKIF